MKRIIFIVIAVFTMGFLFSQSIHNPDVEATITKQWIIENGQNQQSQNRDIVVLDFEGLGNGDEILDFYNGGTSALGFSGVDYGVEFLGNTLSIIDQDDGGTGNFANEPSPSTVMFFLTGAAAGMNIPDGFVDGFSFYYTLNTSAGSVEVYDGLDGSGSLLATLPLPINWQDGGCTGDPTGAFCNWDPVGVAFTGTARSVLFIGVANQCGFDDITFGSESPGLPPEDVPVSNWALFIGLGLIITFSLLRFFKIHR